MPPALLMIRTTYADVSDLDWLTERHQPDAWVWGHIHETVERFSIGRTRMISNPRGYDPKMLEADFNPAIVVLVQ